MEQLQDKLKAWIENDTRDYSEGLSLLTHLTNNRMLIRNLAKNENKYRRDKLLYELQKHYKLLPPITTPIEIEHETDPPAKDTFQGEDDNQEKTDIPPVDPAGGESEPEEKVNSTTNEGGQPGNEITNETGEGTKLLSHRTDAKASEDLEISYSKMYNKKGMLINSLRDVKQEDNEGRKALMEQIAGINSDMQAVDEKIKHFKTHGKLPDPFTEPPAAEAHIEKPIPDDPILMQKMLLNERSNVSKIKKKITDGASTPEKLNDLEQILLKKTELVNEIQRRLGGIGS